MGKLSLKSYVWKCVLGLELIYFICLLGGYIPWRNLTATELHHRLFETMPGFVWGTFSGVIIGAIYMLIFAWIFGAYYVWMHNSSIKS